MRIERTKNTVKNIKAGMLLKIYQMLIPFLMRTAMIYCMGVQYLGLNSLFASILQVLNLAELGVGSAMVFAMYKPIANDDANTICGLMGLYRKYYRIIGFLIGTIGLLLTPLVPHLIAGDVPSEINIYILYLLNLGATVLTYWLFAYKNCLLQAHQRLDVVSAVTAATFTLQSGVQLLILLYFKNYYAFVITKLFTQALNNIVISVVVTKMYPDYKAKGSLEKEEIRVINQKIKDLFTAKLGSVVLKASDSLVISSFLGLTLLAIYQNYFFILSSVIAMVEIVLSSMMAGLGNSYVLESKEKNYRDFEVFSFLFLWLAGMCTCCFLGMYQPFMEIWVGTELMLDFGAVVAFSAYFLVYVFNRLLSIYKDAAGLWHEDRFRPLVTAIANVILNLCWIHKWGIYGVLLSTVLTMLLIGIPWMLSSLFARFFDRYLLKNYVLIALSFGVSTVLSGAIVRILCMQVQFRNTICSLIVCSVISVLVPNLVFWLLYRKHRLFRLGLRFGDTLTKRKLKLEDRLAPEK